MKMSKKILATCCTPCLVFAAATPIIGITSCAPTTKSIEKIKLFTWAGYICPGEHLAVQKDIYPAEAKNQKVNWKIKSTPFAQITISDNGLLYAPADITVTDPTTLTVECSSAENPDICDYLDIVIAPTRGSKFLGFVNSEVEFADFYNRDCVAKIDSTSSGPKTIYYTTKHIDLFSFDQGNLFDFMPIIRTGSSKMMKFTITGSHAITFVDYSEGTSTTKLPQITVGHPDYKTDQITVTFDCDENIEFVIDFNIWESRRESITNPLMGYSPDDEEEGGSPHSVDFKEKGIYSSRLFCPSVGSSGLHTGTMSTIYAYPHRYEYSDLEFYFDESVMEKEVKAWKDENAFTYSYETGIYTRPFDNFKFYTLKFTYTFDLSKVSAKDVDYRSLNIFRLVIRDKILTEQRWSYCNFSIKWV